jgi:hypothetical protein
MSFALSIYRGDNASLQVAVSTDTDARDITNDTLFFTIKENQTDLDAVALTALSTGSGIQHTVPLEGIAVISIAPADTATCPVDVELYADVQLKTTAGQIFTLSTGTVTIVTDITRRTT